MTELWIIVATTGILTALIVKFAYNFHRHLHLSDILADRFVEETAKLANDHTYPEALIEYLFEAGKNVGRFSFAIRFGFHLNFQGKWARSNDQKTIKLRQTLEKLNANQRKRFIETMVLFLLSVSYRDPFFGTYTRDQILAQPQQKIVTKFSDAITH